MYLGNMGATERKSREGLVVHLKVGTFPWRRIVELGIGRERSTITLHESEIEQKLLLRSEPGT